MSVSTSKQVFNPQPTLTSSVVSIFIALLVIALLASAAVQRQLLAVALVGIVVFVYGSRLVDGNRLPGGVLLVVGTLMMLWTIISALTVPQLFTHRLELLPAVGGLWVLAGALFAPDVRWRRTLFDAGIWLMFIAVFVSGILDGSSVPTLVIAATGLFVAWDAGKNAISLGKQVGSTRSTTTRQAELYHSGATAAVGCGVVVAVVGVWWLSIEGIPLVGLIALLLASIALALAVYQ